MILISFFQSFYTEAIGMFVSCYSLFSWHFFAGFWCYKYCCSHTAKNM